MNLEEKTLQRNVIYTGRVIKMRCDTALMPDGKAAGREVVEHPGGVCVAAVDKDDNLLLVRQFRYPYMEEVLEIPAGKRDKAGDSDPLSCGKRELKEETGYTAKDYISLGELYPTPGYCNEVIYMFAAKNLTAGEQCPDEDEFLDVVRLPFERAVDMVVSGEIKDAKTQAAILKLNILRNRKIF